MSGTRTLLQGIGLACGVTVVVVVAHFVAQAPVAIRGAVISASASPEHELPLADVEIAIPGDADSVVRSDASGFFNIPIPFRQRVWRGQPLTLEFRHSGYQPLELQGVALNKLCIARLAPLPRPVPVQTAVNIANVVVKYSISTTTMVNIGSAVKTFSVVNRGNAACKENHPCSPDGRWLAAVGSATLDAGQGNEFRNARASCIAGPCPFTRIEGTNFTSAGQTLHVSALDWSDTATFLMEAEVYRPTVSNVVRDSYPVIFGQALTFTLPAAAQGVSIQADLDKTPIVFPLGPALFLSWAECHLFVNKDQTRVYRCELKPGYRFL